MFALQDHRHVQKLISTVHNFIIGEADYINQILLEYNPHIKAALETSKSTLNCQICPSRVYDKGDVQSHLDLAKR